MSKSKEFKVLVDPRLRAVFSTYYMQGFRDLYGISNVGFASQPFEDLDMKTDKDTYEFFTAVKVTKGNLETRIILDYSDRKDINETGYAWCDVYGKMNLNRKATEERYQEKAVALGPVVGLKLWSRCLAYIYCLRNYAHAKSRMHVDFRYYLAGYNWQSRRPYLPAYFEPEDTLDSYIFFDSSLWEHEHYAAVINNWRAAFMRACKEADVEFEGGFIANENHRDYDKYEDLIYHKSLSTLQWMKEVKRSTIAFNTPSLHGGHGWKLGEFLAMGKAMVSSPILNDLPVPLEHGKNIHFIEKEEELPAAITYLLGNPEYRKGLEKGAAAYWQTYLAPVKMIGRIMERTDL